MTSVEMNDLLDPPPSDSTIESDGEAKPIKPSPATVTATVTSDGRIEFFNARDPQYELQAERPIHRQIVIRAMESGKTNTELAQEFGVTGSMVNYVLLQPWAKKYMSENMHKHGMQKVEVLLKGAVAGAVERLITEMDNPKARAAERISAAEKILERVYGRAAQPMIHVQAAPVKDMSDAELDQEIERLRQQRGS
jgi:hypothetical protein